MQHIFISIIAFIWLAGISPLRAQSPEKAAYDKAIAFMNKGKTQKGFGQLDKALSLNPAYYNARYARGYYYFNEGNYAEAIPDFDVLLQRNSQDTTAYRYRGLANLYTGNFAAAELDLQKAYSMDSTDEGILGELGYFYYQMDQLEQAKYYFTQSLAARPNTYAYYHLAQTHFALGEFNEALQVLDKQLTLNAKDAEAMRLKALIFLNTRKYAEAIKIYEQLLASGTMEEPDDFLNWGMVYYVQKRYPQALTYFKTPKKHRDPELFYLTGLTHYRLKNTKDALKAMNQSVKYLNMNSEESASVFYDRAIVRMAVNDRSGAAADFFQSVMLLPEIVRQHNAGGDSLELLGNAAVLLKGLCTPSQLDSVRAIGYRERARNQLNVVDGERDALKSINQELQLRNTDAESYLIRSRLYYLTDRFREALNDINQAFKLAGNMANDAYYHLRGLIHYEQNNFDKAHQDFTQAITIDPKNAQYLYDRAYASAGRENWAEAITDISQALSLSADDKVTYLLARSGFYLEQHQYTNALADCNQALAGPAGASGLAYYQRGLAHQGLRRYREAVADFTKALQLEPDFPEANEALQEAQLNLGK